MLNSPQTRAVYSNLNTNELHHAIIADNANLLIDHICSKAISINSYRFRDYNDTLLLRAIFERKINCVQVLLRNGADLKCTDQLNYSPLSMAATSGFSDIVEMILKESTTPITDEMIDKAVDAVMDKPEYKYANPKQALFYNIAEKLNLYRLRALQSKVEVRAPVQPLVNMNNSNSHAISPHARFAFEVPKREPIVNTNKPIVQQFNNSKNVSTLVEKENVAPKVMHNANNNPPVNNQKDDALAALLELINNSFQEDFLCKISGEVMEDPVISVSGITYDRKNAEAWIIKNGTEPTNTNVKTTTQELRPNLALKATIENYKKLQVMVEKLNAPEKNVRPLPSIPKK